MSIPVFEVCPNPSHRVSALLAQARKLLSDASSTSTNGVNGGAGHDPESVKKALDSILADAQAVVDGQEDFVQRSSNVPDPKAQWTKILEEMLASTQSTDWGGLFASGQISYRLLPAMSSNNYEAGIITFLSGLLKPRRVLELGMFTGTITLTFAAAKSVERVVTLEVEPFLEGWCRPFWKRAGEGLDEKIDVRVGDARKTIDEMAANGEAPFDMILIDADKPSYLTYFRKIIEHKLLSKNGVMIIDNVLFAGTAYAPYPVPLINPPNIDQASVQRSNGYGVHLKELNSEICNHPEVEVMMLGVEDGLSLVKWKDQ